VAAVAVAEARLPVAEVEAAVVEAVRATPVAAVAVAEARLPAAEVEAAVVASIAADARATTVTAVTTSNSKPRVNPSTGFTLLELLVALAVLSMVVMLLLQTISSTSKASGSTKRHLDMDAEARSVFDRVQADIDSMVIRQDVDALFLGLPQDASGGSDHNDQFYFYSQSPGYSAMTNGLSSVSMVGYAVTNQQLARLGMAKSWDDLPFLTPNVSVTGFDPTNLPQCLGSATNYWHVIGPSVFRMEIGLMMKGATTNADGSVNYSNSYASLSNPSFPRHGMANVAGVVVALGLLDPQSRMSVQPSQMSNLASLLSDCLTNGGIPMNSWETNLAISNGIPPILANRVMLYIRNFPLKR
jgi:prepilin-type N-terminal cleavage/methylation domain-containing protein